MTTNGIEQLIAEQAAAEPGDFQKGDMIQRPASEADQMADGNKLRAGMNVAELVSAGWTILYDTKTFEPSTVNNNQVPDQLKARRPDGTPYFTATYPGEPWRGTYKCFLHKDAPERKMFDNMGFGVCTKDNMPNQYQANLHNEHKHRQEWSAYQDILDSRERERQEKREDALYEAMTGRAMANQTPRAPRTQEQIEADREKMRKVREAKAAKEAEDGTT